MPFRYFKRFFGTVQDTRIVAKLQPAVALKEERKYKTAMSDERTLRLENAMATLAELSANHQRRIARLEESFVTLVDLLQSHGEGIDELRSAQAESERKIAALADAQIRTEERISQLMEAQKQTEVALKQLAESQSHTDQRLDALIDIVRDGRNGQSKN